MSINGGNNLKARNKDPFIGPISVKNLPKNFTSNDYKKAASYDYDNDGVVDYEQVSMNPFYKIDDYIANNATDKEILADIKAYKGKYLSIDPDFCLDDILILSNIKNIINEKKNPTTFIGPVITDEDKRDLAKSDLLKIAQEYYLSKYQGTDYVNSNIAEKWKIENIPCDDETKDALRQLEKMVNEKEASLSAVEELNDEFSITQRPIVNQGGTTGIGNDGTGKALVVLNSGNYYIYEDASKSLLEEQTADVEASRRLLQDLKRTCYINFFENVPYDKNLNPDKRLNYREQKYTYWDDKPGKGDKHTGIMKLNDYISGPTYEYMTISQKQIYCYYLDKYGKDKADEYLFYIQEDINQRAAHAEVELLKENLHLDDEGKLMEDLYNAGIVDNEGFKDGFSGFLINVCSAFLPEEVIGNRTVLDFKRLEILMYLAENSEYLEERYKISEKIGRMIVPAIISFVGTLVSGSPTIGTRLWAILCGLDTAGETARSNAQKGYSGYLYSNAFIHGLGTATIKIIAAELIKNFLCSKFEISEEVLKALTDCLASIVGKGATNFLGELFDTLMTGKPFNHKEVLNKSIEDTLKIAIATALVLGKGLIIKTNAGDITLSTEGIKKVDYSKELLQTLIRMGGNLNGDFKEIVEIVVTSDD